MPHNRSSRIMKHYSPVGRRNYSRPLKRLLGTWDQNGSTSGPTPWQIDDDDEQIVIACFWLYSSCKHLLCPILSLSCTVLVVFTFALNLLSDNANILSYFCHVQPLYFSPFISVILQVSVICLLPLLQKQHWNSHTSVWACKNHERKAQLSYSNSTYIAGEAPSMKILISCK